MSHQGWREGKDLLISLDLLAMLFLGQPRGLLAAFVTGAYCCCMFGSWSIRTFLGFLSSLSVLSVYWFSGAVPLQVQDIALSFVQFHEVPVCSFLQPVLFLDSSRNLWWISLFSCENLLEMQSVPLPSSLKKMSNSTGHIIDPWGTQHSLASSWTWSCLSQPSGTGHSGRF